MTRTQLGNAFGPGRDVDVCDVCGVVVLVPRDGEPEYPEPHKHGSGGLTEDERTALRHICRTSHGGALSLRLEGWARRILAARTPADP